MTNPIIDFQAVMKAINKLTQENIDLKNRIEELERMVQVIDRRTDK